MAKFFKRAFYWLLLLFVPAKPQPIRKQPVRDAELYKFKATILDRLDDYFVILKRMKRADRDSYNLYSKTGAVLVPLSQLHEALIDLGNDELSPWWNENRPSFAAFFVDQHIDGKIGRIPGGFAPVMLYFQKYESRKAPPKIERVSSGSVYVTTVYWDAPDLPEFGIKTGTPTQFAVWVKDDREVRILRLKLDKTQTIRAKKNNRAGRRGSTFTVPNRRWGIDDFFVDWSSEHEMDVADYLITIFVFMANLFANQHSEMTKVSVRKGKLTAVFSIDILRTPYFFADRNITTSTSGRRKPIFHIVRAHRRVRNGVETYIRTHFSGERKFVWNGYHIRINVPGWHHLDMTEFDVGAHNFPDEDARPPGFLDAADVGSGFEDIERQDGKRGVFVRPAKAQAKGKPA